METLVEIGHAEAEEWLLQLGDDDIMAIVKLGSAMVDGEEAPVGTTGAEPSKSEDIEDDKGEGIEPDKSNLQGLRRDDLQYSE